MKYHVGRCTAFPTKLHARPAKTQISLRIRDLIRIFIGHSLSSQGSKAFKVGSEDSDQPVRMVRVFAGRTCSLAEKAFPQAHCSLIEWENRYFFLICVDTLHHSLLLGNVYGKHEF